MQRMTVVVEGEVDRAIGGADAEGYDVVGVVTAEIVIAEPDCPPGPAWQFAAGDADPAMTVVVGNVLMPGVGDDSVLLKRQAVNGPPEAPFNGQGARVDDRVHKLGDNEVRMDQRRERQEYR